MPSSLADLDHIAGLLVDAARQRKVCSILMRDEPEPRIVYPLGVCRSSKNRLMLVCWQEEGHNQSAPGYRNFVLSNCTEGQTVDRKFFVPASFTPEDGQYKDWLYHVKQDDR